MKKIIYLVFAFFAMSSASNAQTISMTGDGVSGWGTDVDMVTSDNNIYTLSNFTFSTGGAKFKKNHSWDADKNWGGSVFPQGTAVANGSNISVTAGVYNVTFNLTTLAVKFTAVAQGFDDISVFGSANGNVDLQMSTTNGINYTILDADLSLGTLIFRKDNANTVTWGNSAFPTGTATSGGTAIDVTPGTYNINFNKTTGAYSFSFAQISVIGSAKGGWSTDTDLTTQDGENYTLNMSAFTTGALKFRKNHAWAQSWGGSTFPNGTGLTSGDIPVQGGNYVVAFNRMTGAYSFSSSYPTISLTSNGVDTDMFSGDGINYSKSNVDIAAGNYQFRQGNANIFVWGASAFPSGTAETYLTTSIAIPGGRYNITFNKDSGAYSFAIKKIGIIGSATPNGWDNITPMTTTDGINYKMNAITLTDGEIKFRQGDDWNTSNWGSASFPAGTGTQGGSNIPLSASKYNINFNVLTGAYVFTDLIRTKVRSSQCGSTLPALNTDIMADFVAGVTEYRFKVVANGATEILDRGNRRYFNLTALTNGAVYNTVYTISVSTKYNGTWSTYGTECTVSTPVVVPVTKVKAAQCGTTLAALNTDIQADWLQFATAYRFKVVDLLGEEQVIERPYRYFNLTALPAGFVNFLNEYKISVSVKHSGTWGAYGTECIINTPDLPQTKVRDAQCGVTLASKTTDILADFVQFATGYTFFVMNFTTGEQYTINTPGSKRYFKLTDLPTTITDGTTYGVRVAASYYGAQPFPSTMCAVATPGNPSNSRQIVESADFNLVAYPNPSNGAFKLQVNGSNNETVSLLVFDMMGRQIENKVVQSNEIENISLGQNYATGVYNVVVSQGVNTKTVRLVKN